MTSAVTWVIASSDQKEFWSNEDGWTEHLECATKFTEDEAQRLNLPIGGSWVSWRWLLSGRPEDSPRQTDQL